MSEAWATGFSILLGAAFLHAFYATVRLRWPESYYSLGDVTAYRLSASPGRYAAFRFGPVFLVTLFVAVSMERAGLGPWIGAIGVVELHAATTSGLAVTQLYREGAGRFNRPALTAAHALIVAMLLVTASVAAVARQAFEGLVPSLTEVRSDLWTAVAAAVLGGYVVHLSQGQAPSSSEIIAASRARLPAGLWELAGRQAEKHQSDVKLVRAIMLVENLQRPSWIRRLEQLKGRLLPEGSYGVMQVHSSSPLSDAESVAMAIEQHLSNMRVPRLQRGRPDHEALQRMVRTYNSDPRFVQLVVEAYFELDRTN